MTEHTQTNEEQLTAFLKEINARPAWENPVGRDGRIGTVTCYICGNPYGAQTVILVQRFHNGEDGFEVFVPAAEGNDINATFDAVREHVRARIAEQKREG